MKKRLFGLLIIALLLAGCTGWQVRTETPTPEPAGIEVVLNASTAYAFDGRLTLEVGEYQSDCQASEGVMLTAFLITGERANGHTFCVTGGTVVEIAGYWIKVLNFAIVENKQTLTLEIADLGTDR